MKEVDDNTLTDNHIIMILATIAAVLLFHNADKILVFFLNYNI